jgi:hypothetical protein
LAQADYAPALTPPAFVRQHKHASVSPIGSNFVARVCGLLARRRQTAYAVSYRLGVGICRPPRRLSALSGKEKTTKPKNDSIILGRLKPPFFPPIFFN